MVLFNMSCVAPTGFLIDDSQKPILKEIDKLFLVIEVESSYESMTRKAQYKKLDANYVRKFAKPILEEASGLEVVHTNDKITDNSFVLIEMESSPYCDNYPFAGHRCPGGEVSGNVSLYLKGNKIFYEWFFTKERVKDRYYGFPPNTGEESALRRSEGFKEILHKIGSEIQRQHSK
jgi:hypothetical protein